MCRSPDWQQRVEVCLVGRLLPQPLVRPRAVVEVEIPAYLGACLRQVGISAQIDLLVFHRFPEAFDEDVVAPGALAIRADPDTGSDQQGRELVAGVKNVIVVMDHANKSGESKVLERCSLPLTGQGVVDLIITDLCMMACDKEKGGGLTLIELAPGISLDEVKAKTQAAFTVAPSLAKAAA